MAGVWLNACWNVAIGDCPLPDLEPYRASLAEAEEEEARKRAAGWRAWAKKLF